MADIKSYDKQVASDATKIHVVAKPQGRAQYYRTTWKVSKNGGSFTSHGSGDKGSAGDGYYNFEISFSPSEMPLADGDYFEFYAEWNYNDPISGNSSKVGNSETVKTIVGSVTPVEPDWKITQPHLNSISAANMSLVVDGKAAAVDTPVNENSVLELTAKSGYLIKTAQIQYNFGGGVAKFTIADNKESASLTWTGGEASGVSFYLESQIKPAKAYTILSSDIKADYKLQINGVDSVAGTDVYVGDTLKIVMVNSAKYIKSASMKGGDGTGIFTISDDGNSASWVAALAGNSVAWTGIQVITEAIPANYALQQKDLDKIAAGHSTMTVDGKAAAVGVVISRGSELALTADSGWIILSASVQNSVGQINTFKVTDGGKKASVVIDEFLDLAYNITFNVSAEQTTPEVRSAFNNIYYVTPETMAEINKARFVLETSGGENPTPETVDYGQYILSLIDLPFKISPDYILESEKVILGNRQFNVETPKINNDVIRVDLGSIAIEPDFNNSRDYVGTTALLHLPRVDPINIDLEYVIGQEISITYDIDVYSGDATINISSTKINDVIITRKVNMGFNVPYINIANVGLENSSITVGGENWVKTPYIEIVRTDLILPEGFYTIPVTDEGKLTGQTGYIEVDNVNLNSKATARERELIIQALQDGVIINDQAI